MWSNQAEDENDLLFSLHQGFSSVMPVLDLVPVEETEQGKLCVRNEIQSLQMKNKTPAFDTTFKILQDFSFFLLRYMKVFYGQPAWHRGIPPLK